MRDHTGEELPWSVKLIRYSLLECMHMYKDRSDNWRVSLMTDKYCIYWAPWIEDHDGLQMSNRIRYLLRPQCPPRHTSPVHIAHHVISPPVHNTRRIKRSAWQKCASNETYYSLYIISKYSSLYSVSWCPA